MVSGERQCLRNTSRMAESSLVTVVMVMLGSCDEVWQPRIGRTLEMLGMDSYSRTPGTVETTNKQQTINKETNNAMRQLVCSEYKNVYTYF